MFEGSATTMLSSLDTVGSLSDDTLLWPGRKIFTVVRDSNKCVSVCHVDVVWMFTSLISVHSRNALIYSQGLERSCTWTSMECKILSVVMHVGMIFNFCPPAIPQVMSMQRTTCCLLLRLSHATLPGKTNISGCCSSEARSCARWEWYITIVLPF